MSTWGPFRNCEKGTSAIEFGLLAPILLIMLLGLIDFGFAWIKKMELSSAARAGAQYALLEGYDSTTVQSVVTNATNLTDITFDTLTTYCQCEDGTSVTCGDTCTDGSSNRKWVTITISAPIEAYFFESVITSVSATAEMQIQ